MRKLLRCRTLMGTRNLDFSIACLQSLVNNSYDEIQLQIFEDGSITGIYEEKVLAALPDAVIISKKQREDIVARKLNPYPKCLQFVEQQKIFAMKLFDTMLYDEEDFVYVDSDIFFLKKFCFPEFANRPVFMKDTENSYCFHPKDFFKINFPIYSFVNAGFNYFPKKYFQLDKIEQLLENKVLSKSMAHFYSEQTLWALLAAGIKMDFFDATQVMMAEEKMKITGEAIAVHLVSAYRYHFEELQLIGSEKKQDERYATMRLQSATEYLSKWEYGISRFSKRAKAYLAPKKTHKKIQRVAIAQA